METVELIKTPFVESFSHIPSMRIYLLVHIITSWSIPQSNTQRKISSVMKVVMKNKDTIMKSKNRHGQNQAETKKNGKAHFYFKEKGNEFSNNVKESTSLGMKRRSGYAWISNTKAFFDEMWKYLVVYLLISFPFLFNIYFYKNIPS